MGGTLVFTVMLHIVVGRVSGNVTHHLPLRCVGLRYRKLNLLFCFIEFIVNI